MDTKNTVTIDPQTGQKVLILSQTSVTIGIAGFFIGSFWAGFLFKSVLDLAKSKMAPQPVVIPVPVVEEATIPAKVDTTTNSTTTVETSSKNGLEPDVVTIKENGQKTEQTAVTR